MSLKQLQRVIDFAKEQAHLWKDTAPYKVDGRLISVTGERSLTIELVNLYHLTAWVIKPATAPSGNAKHCSMVELLCRQAQLPHWFVSHWWGERVLDFFAVLEKHAFVRHLGEAFELLEKGGEDWYWVCAYANRQHELSKALTADPEKTSFYNAMKIAMKNKGGVILVLDDEVQPFKDREKTGPATPFTRIWCAFEESKALALGINLDIGAVSNKTVHLLTHGQVETDGTGDIGTFRKGFRDKSFPVNVLATALNTTLETAEATNDADRVHILNSLSGQSLEATPLSEHENFAITNKRLRSKFAISGMRAQLEADASLGAFVKCIRDDDTLKAITWDFTTCDKVTDQIATQIAQSFPTSLEELSLTLEGRHITDVAMQSIATHLRRTSLQKLFLSVFMGSEITDGGVKSLAEALRGSALTVLALKLDGANVTDDGVKALASQLRDVQLTSLTISVHGTSVSHKMQSTVVKKAFTDDADRVSFFDRCLTV